MTQESDDAKIEKIIEQSVQQLEQKLLDNKELTQAQFNNLFLYHQIKKLKQMSTKIDRFLEDSSR